MQNLEEAIRERAYHLWVAAGQPHGSADAHWLNAQREILATSLEGHLGETAWSAAMQSASVAAKPAKKPKVARPRKSKRNVS